MADNVSVTAGSGTSIAADEISSVYYQRVKVGLGADGTANDWTAGAGVNGTGVARVTIATDDAMSAAITGAIYADDADWTDSTSKHLLAGGVHETTPQSVTAGDTGPFQIDSRGALLTKPFAHGGSEWSYAAASGGIDNTTTAVTVAAAAGAGIRNYITSLQINHNTLGAATEFAIRDGAAGTVIWRVGLNTTAAVPINITFPVPLKSTANTLLEVVTLTAVTGDVFVNMQGYTAP